MLHHCPNEPCRYFSPNLYSLRYHLEQCVFRGPDSVSPSKTSPCSSPNSAKRPKHEHSSEPVGGQPSRFGPFLPERVSKVVKRNVVEPTSSDRSRKQPPNPLLFHPGRRGKEAVVEKGSEMEGTFGDRKPGKSKSFPTSNTVPPESRMRIETPLAVGPIASESKESLPGGTSASKEGDSEQIPFSLFDMEPDDPARRKTELQDMHVDYMVVCLGSVANSMGEKVADEIISALNHPFFDLNKFRKGVVSAHMCKERTNSIAKRYVGFAVRQRLKSLKVKQSEE